MGQITFNLQDWRRPVKAKKQKQKAWVAPPEMERFADEGETTSRCGTTDTTEREIRWRCGVDKIIYEGGLCMLKRGTRSGSGRGGELGERLHWNYK